MAVVNNCSVLALANRKIATDKCDDSAPVVELFEVTRTRQGVTSE